MWQLVSSNPGKGQLKANWPHAETHLTEKTGGFAPDCKPRRRAVAPTRTPLKNRTHLVVYLPGCDSCESVYVPSNLWKSSRGPGLTSNEFKADFCPFSTHLIYSFQNSGAPKRKVSRCREVSPWKGKLRILWISQNVTTTYCNNFATWQGFYHSLDNRVPQAARFCWQRWSKMGKRINSSKK